MSILESALKLSEIVLYLASEKGISKEEAWDEAIEKFREKYENEKE